MIPLPCILWALLTAVSIAIFLFSSSGKAQSSRKGLLNWFSWLWISHLRTFSLDVGAQHAVLPYRRYHFTDRRSVGTSD